MWINTKGVLIHLDRMFIIKRCGSTQIEFYCQKGFSSSDVNYDSKEERESEFKRISDLLLKILPGTIESSVES